MVPGSKWTSSVSVGLLSGAGGPRLSWMGPYPLWSNVNLDGLKGAGWLQDGPWSLDFSMVPSGFKLVYPKTNMVLGGA